METHHFPERKIQRIRKENQHKFPESKQKSPNRIRAWGWSSRRPGKPEFSLLNWQGQCTKGQTKPASRSSSMEPQAVENNQSIGQNIMQFCIVSNINSCFDPIALQHKHQITVVCYGVYVKINIPAKQLQTCHVFAIVNLGWWPSIPLRAWF